MRLEPSERETIILFSDADDTASVYTFDKKLKARLKELHRRQPEIGRASCRERVCLYV